MDIATLLLIRHGETAWNAESRIQGQLDVPLSNAGIWQAGRLAQRLAGERIDAIFASDLARAWLTAQPIGHSRQVDAVPDLRLRERHFGIFQGHTLDEISTRWPGEFASWRERDPEWVIPGGESGREFIERVLDALDEIAQRHAGQMVAVVAHGGVLDVAYRHARGLAWNAPRQHLMVNAALNRVAARAQPLRIEVLEWGDVAHLATARDELAGV
ncbi:MAG TPA: histidine phosphatase family protein [Burkholderiaceae bacterium]|nr:histidine phosphatase family protein [Burkholderiaceae bacterium]